LRPVEASEPTRRAQRQRELLPPPVPTRPQVARARLPPAPRLPPVRPAALQRRALPRLAGARPARRANRPADALRARLRFPVPPTDPPRRARARWLRQDRPLRPRRAPSPAAPARALHLHPEPLRPPARCGAEPVLPSRPG